MAYTYDALATTTLGSATNVIQFTSISSTYSDLRLVCYLRFTANAAIYIRFNGSTALNYAYAGTTQTGGTFSTGTYNSGMAEIRMTPNITAPISSASTSGVTSIIDIIGYANTNWSSKSLYLKSGYVNTALTSYATCIVGGLETTIQTISSVSLTTSAGNFDTGSIVTLYGIKGA